MSPESGDYIAGTFILFSNVRNKNTRLRFRYEEYVSPERYNLATYVRTVACLYVILAKNNNYVECTFNVCKCYMTSSQECYQPEMSRARSSRAVLGICLLSTRFNNPLWILCSRRTWRDSGSENLRQLCNYCTRSDVLLIRITMCVCVIT